MLIQAPCFPVGFDRRDPSLVLDEVGVAGWNRERRVETMTVCGWHEF